MATNLDSETVSNFARENGYILKRADGGGYWLDRLDDNEIRRDDCDRLPNLISVNDTLESIKRNRSAAERLEQQRIPIYRRRDDGVMEILRFVDLIDLPYAIISAWEAGNLYGVYEYPEGSYTENYIATFRTGEEIPFCL